MAPPVIWTFEPSVIVGVGALSLAYICGWLRARQPGQPHPPGYDRLALFALSMLCVLVALVSPVDTWSTDFLFVHMIQHLLLLDLMPIALILSLTKGILRPVTRKVTVIERRIGPLGHPAFALVAYISMMIVWHIPALYDVALVHPLVHVGEHVCFAAAGSLYWWHLLSPIKARQHLAGMGPVMYMVITKLTVGILGVILAFAPHSFYGWYEHHIHYMNLSPTVDQNLAGLIMALEQSIVMGIAVGYFFVRALNESEAKVLREERFAVQTIASPSGVTDLSDPVEIEAFERADVPSSRPVPAKAAVLPPQPARQAQPWRPPGDLARGVEDEVRAGPRRLRRPRKGDAGLSEVRDGESLDRQLT